MTIIYTITTRNLLFKELDCKILAIDYTMPIQNVCRRTYLADNKWNIS